MEQLQINLLLIAGIALGLCSVLLRVLTDGKHEIKLIDLLFVVVPLLFAGVALGKLTQFDVLGVRADLSSIWSEAVDREIKNQVSSAPVTQIEDAVEYIEFAPKRSAADIPKLIAQKTAAVSFRLSQGNYNETVIRQYFDALYGSASLQFVLLENPDGTLFGLYQAADLISYLRSSGNDAYTEFEQQLNDGIEFAKQWLARLPGFIPVELAVTSHTSKRDALVKMDKHNLDILPVVTSSGRYAGTIDRAKLTSGLLLEITQQLSRNNQSDLSIPAAE